jgi:signal peptide peptidase SppA
MHNKSYEHVVSFAVDHPWAITEPMMRVIAGILTRRIKGEPVDPHVIEAALQNRKNLPQPMAGSVAIIPVHGVLAPRVNMMTDMSGGTTYDKLTAQLRESLANKSVKTIVLDVDSPGGNIAGMIEFAREVMRARTKKPVIAVAQYTMASAAYIVASAATEIVAAPSAKVGSIGIYTMHDDLSKAYEEMGLKRTYIAAGKGKVDGNEAEPLSPEAAARIQTMVDDAYAQATDTVIKGRGQGMTREKVQNDWKAHLYSAQEALALGMIDGIATLDETIARVLSASPNPADQRAAIDFNHLAAVSDTSQEPDTATDQDRGTDADLERAVLELQLS